MSLAIVIKLADLKKVNEQPESLRSKFFLEELPTDVIKEYIQDTIREKILSELMGSIKDELYVFAPHHGFRYQISGSGAFTSATRLNEFGSEGTLDEAVKHILDSAEEAKREQKKFSINVLFYDEPSKRAFDEKIKPILDLSYIDRLKVPNYGDVQLHNYWIPHFK